MDMSSCRPLRMNDDYDEQKDIPRACHLSMSWKKSVPMEFLTWFQQPRVLHDVKSGLKIVT